MAGMVNQDDEHLRILSICHYVYGEVKAAFACIPLIYVAIGLVIVFAGAAEWFDEGAPPAVIGAAVVLFGWAVAACVVYAGGLNDPLRLRHVAAQRHAARASCP